MIDTVESRLARRALTLDRVRGLLIETLNVQREVDEIDPDTPLFATGLGLDSIDFVDLVIALDTRFGSKVPDGPEGRVILRTVNSVVEWLMQKGRTEGEN